MKAIIASVLSAIVAVVGMTTSAGAIGVSGAGSTAITNSGWAKMGITQDGKPYFYGDNTVCMSSAMVFNTNFHQAEPVPQNVVQQAPNQGCNAQQVVTNPPANTTVTINGVCGDPAEIAKIKATHANLIINSVGPCPTDGSKPATPATVIVKETVVKTASATTNTTPVTLPETGIGGMPLLAGSLAILAYGATMAVRALRG